LKDSNGLSTVTDYDIVEDFLRTTFEEIPSLPRPLAFRLEQCVRMQ
jgi:hypothetical protein